MLNKNRIKWIDAVKGFSILFIFFIHMENWTNLFLKYKLIHSLICKGTLGVEFTYICNAYLMCKKYNNYTDLWGGCITNMLRILPLYFIACSIFTIFNINGLLNENPSIINVISHFLFISILNPVWWNTFPGTGYMAVLFIMWPLFLIYKKYITNFGRAIIGFSIIYLISQFMMMFSDLYCLIDDCILWNTYISYIFRGIQSFAFAPIIFYFPKNELFMTDHKKLFSFSLILISLVSITLMIYSKVNFNILYVFVLMPTLLSFNIYESKIIVNKISCFLGKYIFGIYLFHILGYFILVKFVNNIIFLWFLNFIISIALSYFSNKFIEKPFIIFTKKIWRIK